MTVIQAVVLIVVTVVVGAAVLVATAAQLQVVEAGAAEVAAIALTVPTFVYEYEHRYLYVPGTGNLVQVYKRARQVSSPEPQRDQPDTDTRVTQKSREVGRPSRGDFLGVPSKERVNTLSRGKLYSPSHSFHKIAENCLTKLYKHSPKP